MNHKLVLAAIVVGGMFIGIVRGQEARSRWISKMRIRNENKKTDHAENKDEVALDDFEIASFHRN